MKWFKHDSDAHRNKKLKKLQIKYGFVGTGLYWHCLELIAQDVDKHNLTFELEHDAEILAHEGKIDTRLCEEIMRYMIELELFESSGGQITCMKLAQRIENSIVKSPQLKAIQERLEKLENKQNQEPGKSGIIPDDPGKSLTVRDDPGQSGNSSENFGLDIDLELDTTTTTEYITPAWEPNENCRQALADNLVPEYFVETYLDEFKLFWIDSGRKKPNWNYTFFEQCRQQWQKQNQKPGSSNGKKPPKPAGQPNAPPA